MGLESISTSLVAHFNTQWANATPIAWDNVTFNATNVPEYVNFTVLPNKQFQASMGSPTSNRYRQQGMITVRIFTVLNRGAKRAMQLADQVAAIFRSKTIAGIVFSAPSITVVGQSDGVYQVNVAVAFYNDSFY
jgi:hypothetical protein